MLKYFSVLWCRHEDVDMMQTYIIYIFKEKIMQLKNLIQTNLSKELN